MPQTGDYPPVPFNSGSPRAVGPLVVESMKITKLSDQPTDYPNCPAAWINFLAEEGSREELLDALQETWDEMMYYKKIVVESATNKG